MASFEQINELMRDLGPVLDPMAIDAASEHSFWGITLEEDLAVMVQFDEQKNCLVLSCELGAPPMGDRTALYELLLQFNFHWEATGGNRMAIDGPEGDVVLMVEIGADGLDASRMTGIVGSFAQAARAWREVVQRPVEARESTLGGRPDLGMSV